PCQSTAASICIKTVRPNAEPLSRCGLYKGRFRSRHWLFSLGRCSRRICPDGAPRPPSLGCRHRVEMRCSPVVRSAAPQYRITPTRGSVMRGGSPDRVERRLAAILAADVAGYSRLMGQDEAGTLARMRKLRREVIDPEVAERKGRIVKTTGDGLLIEFPSVVEAVACAVSIQREMAELSGDGVPEQRIEFRVGINLGDVIVEDGDIHGDGVNVAARVEALAEPGGICVSEDTFRQVHGKVDAEFIDTGEHQLKNIARPIRMYRVVQAGRAAASVATPGPPLPLPDKPSIAV